MIDASPMMMNRESRSQGFGSLGYKKFCYWVDPSDIMGIRASLRQQGILLAQETHIPCRVLRVSKEIGHVTPEAWRGLCKRRTSWYWNSEKAEKHLLVTRSRLDVDGLEKPIIISESGFHPVRFPSSQDLSELVASPEYQKRKPQAWEKVDPDERITYQKWLDRLGHGGSLAFEEIFLIHSANHANFLSPRFFITVNDQVAPYSISDTFHVCSSCAEFFNILGEPFSVKYVVPCPGAVLFARLPMNGYLKVEIHDPPAHFLGSETEASSG